MKDIKQLREDFERNMRNRHFKIDVNEHGEYLQPAVFHMWTGYCLSALDNDVVQRNEHGFVDGYEKINVGNPADILHMPNCEIDVALMFKALAQFELTMRGNTDLHKELLTRSLEKTAGRRGCQFKSES